MPSVSDLSESKFLGKDDVGNGLLVTVVGYEKANMAKDNEAPEWKWTIKFKECKPLSLNVTNGMMMGHIAAETHGVTRDLQMDPDSEGDPNAVATPANTQFCNWIGKQFVLYNDPTIMYQKKLTGGVRVRAPQQQTSQPQTQGGVTPEQKQEYDGSSGRRPLSREAEAESAKQFADDYDLGDIEGEGQQH